MGLIASLDHAVRRSGLYRMTMIERPEPRSLRWVPLIVLVAIAVGYALIVAALGTHDIGSALLMSGAGGLVFTLGLVAATFLRFFGPRLILDPRNPLDERELIVRSRAIAVAGTMASFAAMMACFYFAVAMPFGLWMPQGPVEWSLLGFAIQGAWLILPTLTASWLQPRPEPGD